MPLRVTVELIPKGDEAAKRKFAVIDIVNDGTGDEHYGNYDVLAEGECIGGWDTMYAGKVKHVARGDYLNTVIMCLAELHKA